MPEFACQAASIIACEHERGEPTHGIRVNVDVRGKKNFLCWARGWTNVIRAESVLRKVCLHRIDVWTYICAATAGCHQTGTLHSRVHTWTRQRRAANEAANSLWSTESRRIAFDASANGRQNFKRNSLPRSGVDAALQPRQIQYTVYLYRPIHKRTTPILFTTNKKKEEDQITWLD